MLRWLIPILLLLNLVLFAWGYLQPQPREEAPAPLPDGVPTIRLLSERDQPQPAAATRGSKETGLQAVQSGAKSHAPSTRPDVTMSAAALESPEPAVQEQRPIRCLRLGPFERQATAAVVAEGLTSAGHDARLQVKIERSQSGYWVLIPPGGEDPDFVIVNLELAGIQDLWRFDTGELAGAISLGLYSDRKQARARLGELEERGFDAEIRPRQVEKSGYWIESSYPQGDEAAEGALEQFYVEHQLLGYPPPECEEVATP